MIYGYILIRKRNGTDGPQFPVKKSVKIGRSTQCDVRIHVQSVSEQHCLVMVGKDKRAAIENLSATSPTIINGAPVKNNMELMHGDIVTVGERSFTWHYPQNSPFYEGRKIVVKKRRKSEADSTIQNVAVVKPLYHKRRTLGPSVTFPEWSNAIRSLAVEAVADLKHGAPGKSPFGKTLKIKALKASKTPRKSQGTPVAKYATSSVGSPNIKTPSKMQRSSLAKTPGEQFSSDAIPGKQTPAKRLSSANTPSKRFSLSKTPTKTPLKKTPVRCISVGKTPAGATPAKNTPAKPSPSKQVSAKKRISVSNTSSTFSPLAKASSKRRSVTKTPDVKTPVGKSPATRTPASKSSSAKVLASKSPHVKTPVRKSSLRISIKTPKGKSSSPSLKSKSALGSLKRSAAQKRRLSTSPPVILKRMRMDSSKSADKSKRKSPKETPASTLSTVKLILSSKKTPIIKVIKTPHSSTAKKQNSNRLTPRPSTKSSMKKTRRPLFSEILKKKAVQKANAVAKKLLLAPIAPPKAACKKVVKPVLSTEIPIKFNFSSTGHANSPEPIFIGRKVLSTPVVTKKGRKNPVLVTHHTVKDNVDLAGIPEMFKTPGKVPSGTLSPSPSKSSLAHASRMSAKLLSPEVVSKSMTPVQSPQGILKLSSAGKRRKTSMQSMTLSPKASPQPGQASVSARSRNSLLSAEPLKVLLSPRNTRKSSVKTPASKRGNQSFAMSSTNQQLSLLTSTPAAFGQRPPSVGLAFDSPSSVLSGYRSVPHSPASGRKSRLEMAAHKSSYIHSPNASPVKSSLKSSPSKSPQSGELSKNLSVSFSDNVQFQTHSGSKKGFNVTASLTCPASPFSDGCSSAGTPDATTFDFNSIKTPNVPREMFVSSILSSGASSNGQASGSAKRKGKALHSSPCDLNDLHGVRRLLKTPSSPAGYVDVKGVKRLMAASSKTPTYLAVEGVKKLFGDAAAAAGNELSSFVGVRELFASPSSPKTKKSGRFSPNRIPEETVRKSSPVAKIQAEVEGKKTPTFSPTKNSQVSHHSTPHVEKSSLSASGKRSFSSTKPNSPKRDSPKTPFISKEILSTTPPSNAVTESRALPKRTRNTGKKVYDAKAESSPESMRKSLEKKSTQKRGRKLTKVSSPSVQETESALDSSKKRTTRRTAKDSPSSGKSVEKDIPVAPSKKRAKVPSPSLSEASATSKRTSKRAPRAVKGANVISPVKDSSVKGSSKRVRSASPPSALDHVSPVKRTRRGATRKPEVSKTPSPTAVPPNRRRKRQNADITSVAEKNFKSASPTLKSPSPKKSPVTRRTRKGAVMKNESTLKENPSPTKKAAPDSRKRKVVTFDDEAVTPKKKGKATASNRKGNSTTDQYDETSPVITTRPKRAGSSKKRTLPGEASSSQSNKISTPPSTSISPRRTRSRR